MTSVDAAPTAKPPNAPPTATAAPPVGSGVAPPTAEDPPGPSAALTAADAHIAKAEWDAACAVLTTAGTTTPVLDKLAFCLSRAKRFDEALDILTELARRRPSEARYPHMIGYQLYAQERYADAIPYFRTAYRLDPGHIRNLYRLAQARLKTGDETRAQLAACQVLRLWHAAPAKVQERERVAFARASYLLGRAQLARDPAGAADLLRQAAEHDPRDADKQYLLGKALRKACRPSEAVVALRRAQQIEAGKLYIDLELAVALANAGEREAAAELLSRLARRLRAWDALKGARLAVTLEDPPTAQDLLERASDKGFVRRSSAFAAVKAAVMQLPAPPNSAGRHERSVEPRRPRGPTLAECVGRVAMINSERNFGFLVDNADGTRRHFRLGRGFRPRRGDLVRYVPVDAEKGPAADVLGLRD